MSRMRIRWRLSKVGRRSCCRWQYSQASPMLHSPLEKRMHGRRHRWGCPRLPLPPRFSGITAPTSTGTGCTGSCSGTAGAATAGAATAGAATAGAATAGAATAGAATAGAATAGAGGGTGGAGWWEIGAGPLLQVGHILSILRIGCVLRLNLFPLLHV